jgi:phenylpropionate dioxygenase-like ring-hydroxylating dioxygenase large terminal subunit
MSPKFNFFQHWYPLLPVEDLDPLKPTPAILLGMSLVIWKPINSDRYRVFLDRCPHRLAPLSEGKIDEKTGNLMCSYHGWQFDETGSCTRIPQAENSLLQEKFCVTSLPSRQVNDLLWVWGDIHSIDKAETTPLPLSPQIDSEKGFVWSSFVRDLEYDWQTLIENVADPSHVPFAHHGVQGNRDRATPISLSIVSSTEDIIEVITERSFPTKITFEPPCRLEYAISFNSGRQVGLITYCIPTNPGKSRIVAQFSRNFATTLNRFTPRWWDHLHNRNVVLDGDMILLKQQELKLQQEEGKWKTAYKMPTGADRLVIEFRRWFDRYCDGNLPWQDSVINSPSTSNYDRYSILDRYHQHTQHCNSCRNALKNIKRSQILLLVYFVAILSSVALLPDSLRLSLGLPLMSSALLGLAVAAWLKFRLQPKCYFVDYIHAEK